MNRRSLPTIFVLVYVALLGVLGILQDLKLLGIVAVVGAAAVAVLLVLREEKPGVVAQPLAPPPPVVPKVSTRKQTPRSR